MKARDRFITLFALALLGLLAFVWFMPTGIKQVPDIELSALNGRSIRLAELRGRPLLVNFWATTCPGCMEEMPRLAQIYRELAPQGLEIVGIAMDYDPPKDVMELSKRRQIPYLIAHDTHAKAAQAFGDVRLTPTTFLIAPNGRIVQQTIGEVDVAHLRQSILEMLHQPKA